MMGRVSEFKFRRLGSTRKQLPRINISFIFKIPLKNNPNWNCRDKYEVFPRREFSYIRHRINGYCEAILSQNIG